MISFALSNNRVYNYASRLNMNNVIIGNNFMQFIKNLFVFSLLILLIASCTHKNPEYDQMREIYNKYNDNGHFTYSKESVKVLHELAAKGFCPADIQLGNLNRDAKNYIKAKEWYKKSLSHGCYDLGHVGVMNEFIDLTEKSSNGDYSAANKLGEIYYGQKDKALALQWFKKALEGGYVNAKYNIGLVYFYGGDGVKKDHAQALKYFQPLAQEGDVNSQIKMGQIYFDNDGVIPNYTLAKEWFEKAENSGKQFPVAEFGWVNLQGLKPLKTIYDPKLTDLEAHIYVQSRLGYMYYYGLGTTKNYTQAKLWLGKVKGNSSICKALNHSKNKLWLAEVKNNINFSKALLITINNDGGYGVNQNKALANKLFMELARDLLSENLYDFVKSLSKEKLDKIIAVFSKELAKEASISTTTVITSMVSSISAVTN